MYSPYVLTLCTHSMYSLYVLTTCIDVQFADDAAMEMALLRLAPLVPQASVPAYNTAVCRLCQLPGGIADNTGGGVGNATSAAAGSGSMGTKTKMGEGKGGGPGLGKRKQQPSPSQSLSSQHGGSQASSSSSSSFHHSSSSSSSSSSSIPSSQSYGIAALAGGSQRSQPSKRAKLILESAQGGSNARYDFLSGYLSVYRPFFID